MTYILNIETATKNCSVSVAKNGKTLLCKEKAEEGYSHAEQLHAFIGDVLQEAQLDFKDLTAIAVSKGPGSYTGLRIGVSAAKGLCYALGIPLFAVDTLAALALQLQISEGLIVPLLDARRMEVYSAIYSSTYQRIRSVEAEIISENSFQEFSEPLHFVGDCQEKCREVLTRSNFIFHSKIKHPSANEMGSLSYELFQQNDFVDLAYFEPYYLKDFLVTTKKSL